MKLNFKNLLNSFSHFITPEFLKNFMFLLSGSVFIQLLHTISIPVLARYYPIESFGLLEAFLSYSSILAVVSTFRCELILGLPKKKKNVLDVVYFCFIINLISCFIFFTFIIFFNFYVNKYLFVVYVFFVSSSEILRHFLLKLEKYKEFSFSKSVKSISIIFFAFIFLAMNLHRRGLIWAYFIGEVIQFLYIFYLLGRDLLGYRFKWEAIWRTVSIYKKTVLSLVVSYLIGTMALKLPSIIISLSGDFKVLGFYSIIIQMIGGITLISNNIGSIYRQEAIKLFNKKINFDKIFKLYFLKSFIIGILPFYILIFHSSFVIQSFLGNQWKGMESYLTILAISGFVGFCTTTVDKSPIIFQKKKYIFGWNLSRLCLIGCASFFLLNNYINLKIYFLCLMLINVIIYIYDFFYGYFLSKKVSYE